MGGGEKAERVEARTKRKRWKEGGEIGIYAMAGRVEFVGEGGVELRQRKQRFKERERVEGWAEEETRRQPLFDNKETRGIDREEYLLT